MRHRAIALTATALLGAGLSALGAAPAVAATHTVTPGDTFYDLAAANRTSVAALSAVNPGLDAHRLQLGQVLNLPGRSTASGAAAAPTTALTAAPAAAAATHTVVAGDTLYDLAAAHHTTVTALVAANPGLRARRLTPGTVVVLRTASAGSAAPPASATPPKGPTAPIATTFAGRSYASAVTASATAHRDALAEQDVPSRAAMRSTVAAAADTLGVDRSLALAVAHQESGFNMRAVSPADAVGVMQVLPSSVTWASQLVGRRLDPLDPQDNATAGVAILAQLTRTAPDEDTAIAGYYQGLAGVTAHGMAPDTQRYVASVQAQRSSFR